MEKTYIGIDVGEKGYIAVQNGDGEKEFYAISDHDTYDLADILRGLVARYSCAYITAVIEDVHAIFGSSAKGTFNFGYNKGMLIGLLCASGIRYTLVAPKDWQTEMWTNADKEYEYKEVTKKGEKVVQKRVDTKKTSINAAKRLFPDVDFRRTEKCKKIDDNKVDAMLMSEYARRKNL